ncbi:hypothetical protein V495_00221 [Pseudogymnoascus sp. VKM F-4514 (FW-929)]|nr:hypothetical protein V495_00221 [Pseudogymnoascus sp. VKM F-4514 (FW-929)]KFY67340.1 hypothetical protein V497_00453 [Pseudogymnoascus sp. VKM F-4516 (FW-969)]
MPEFLVTDANSRSTDFIQQPPRPEDVRIRRSQRTSCSELSGQSKPEVSHTNNPESSRLDSNLTGSESQTILPSSMTSKESKLLYINVVASLSTWAVLAGITVFPTVSAFIRNSRALEGIERAGNIVLNTVEDIPPLVAGGLCCVYWILGLSWLCWESKGHHVWQTERILLPTVLNSIFSIVTALANVYTPHSKHWAVITLEVVATALNMTTAAIVLYIAYAQSSEDWDGDYVSNKVHTA